MRVLDDPSIKKVEFYDFVKIIVFDGLIHDRSAYETLTKKYGLSDPRISPFNVLKMRVRALKFERIFVFYKDDSFAKH